MYKVLNASAACTGKPKANGQTTLSQPVATRLGVTGRDTISGCTGSGDGRPSPPQDDATAFLVTGPDSLSSRRLGYQLGHYQA